MLRLVLINFLIAAIYFGLFAAQSVAMTESLFWASLIFLPHGWRLVSFFLFRFSGLPGLFVGHLATCIAFFGQVEETIGLYIITSLQGALSLPIIYLALKSFGLDLLATRSDYPVVPWTSFAWLGALSTLANGVLVAVANAWFFNSAVNWQQAGQYLVGDFVGAVVFIAGLVFFFRWQRHRALEY